MTLQKFSKLVYWTMWLALATSLILWIVFSYLNWEFISNPNLAPYYNEFNSVFAYSEHLAVFKDVGFDLPHIIISIVVYLHTLLLLHYFFENHLLLTPSKWAFILVTILFAVFSRFIFDMIRFINLRDYLGFSIEYSFGGIVLYTLLFSMLFSFIGSIIKLILSKFKKNLGFLSLGIISSLMSFIGWLLYFELFFD